MKTIYKYELKEDTCDVQVVKMPIDSKILSIQLQCGKLCIWAFVDTKRENEERHFYIIGTGYPAPDNPSEYIGTFQLLGGSFVGHVFELIKQ